MKKGELKRGFKAFRSNAKSNSGTLKRIRSCKSCKFYDDIELCTNNSVTKFDYIEEDNNSYCCYWTPTWENNC